MINLFGSPAGRAITEVSSSKSCMPDVNSHRSQPTTNHHHQQPLTVAPKHNHPHHHNHLSPFRQSTQPHQSANPHHRSPQNQSSSPSSQHYQPLPFHIDSYHHQSLHNQQPEQHHHHHQLIRGGSSGDLDNFLLLQHNPHPKNNHRPSSIPATSTNGSANQHQPSADKSKKSLIFKSNVMLAKKAKFWKFLEDDDKGSKKNSLEDLSSASSGKSSR